MAALTSSASALAGGAPSAVERQLLAGAWLPEELWAAVLDERPSALWCVQGTQQGDHSRQVQASD